MPDKLLIDGVVRQVNDQVAQRDRLAGIGLPPDLNAAETSAWRRLLPRRMPWRSIAKFEDRILELERRHDELMREQADLVERRQAAPDRYTEALAQWQLEGQKGPRPEPELPAIEADIERHQGELYALRRAVDKVSAQRAEYVAKHRQRLVEEANRHVEEKRARASEALEQYEQARAALVEARSVSLWASLYPDGEAAREPSFGALAGGLRRVGEKLGLQQSTAVELIIAALQEDIAWCASAATREQRAKIDPRPVTAGEWRRDARTGEWVRVDRERDRALEAAGSLHRQVAQDQRTGELERLRKRL